MNGKRWQAERKDKILLKFVVIASQLAILGVRQRVGVCVCAVTCDVQFVL